MSFDMSVFADAAHATLDATEDTSHLLPAKIAFGVISKARYIAPSFGEIEVQGIIETVLPFPLANCAGPVITALAADPAALVGREVMVIVGSQRACIVCVLGVLPSGDH